MSNLNDNLLEKLVDVAKEAGRAVLDVYEDDFEVSFKEDSSPLTEADRRSHEIIVKRLQQLSPDIPILSEEGRDIPFEERRLWKSFFLVDPLDGTKEFVNRNGEFTVNIAMVEAGRTVLGVVHVPVRGVTYYAAELHGAFRQWKGNASERIAVRGASDEGLVVVASRSHASSDLEDFLKKFKVKERISRGSSLKFCLVAEGGADIYPRLGPTWEWDTAAGHSIVEQAGGSVIDLHGNPLIYNKDTLKNDGFLVLGSGSLREMLF